MADLDPGFAADVGWDLSHGGVDMKKHPSGRPIRDRHIKASPYRSAPDEPITPGLRRQKGTKAIGFTVDLLSNEKRHDALIEERRK